MESSPEPTKLERLVDLFLTTKTESLTSLAVQWREDQRRAQLLVPIMEKYLDEEAKSN